MSRTGWRKKRMHAVLAATSAATALTSAALADPNTTVDYTIRNVQNTNWSLNTDWSPNSSSGGPDAAGLYVSLTASISNVRTVTVWNGDFGDSTKTIGRLDIGDTSNFSSSDRFVITGGSSNGVLDFNGNGGAAIVTVMGSSSGDQINVNTTLSSDLDITNGATVTTSTLRLGNISAANAQTITLKRGQVLFNGTVGSNITLRLGDGSGTLSAGMTFASNTYNSNIVARSGTSGNTLSLGNSSNTTPILAGLVTMDHDLTVRAGGSGSLTLSGTVSGAALTGSSNLLVAGSSATNIIALGGNNSSFDGAVSVNSGTFRVTNANALRSVNPVAVDTAASFILSTSATAAVDQTIAGLTNGANGGGTVSNLSTQTRRLTLGGDGNYTFGGSITGTTLSTMGLTKSGAGTQTLTGVSNYTGTTTVSAGKLIVGDGTSGSLGNTAVNVVGGTLGGRGAITGSVNVGASGTLAAGIASAGSIGTLSTGNLALSGTLAVDVDATANVADQVAVTGTVNVEGATLNLSVLPVVGSEPYNGIFVLINNDGGLISEDGDAIVGSFAGLTRGGVDDSAVLISGGLHATVFYGYDAATSAFTGGNDLAIQFTSVPEPGTLLLSGVPLVLLSRRRRRRCESAQRS